MGVGVSCTMGEIVLRGTYPKGVLVLVGNWQRDGCHMVGVVRRVVSPRVIVLRGVVPGVVVLELLIGLRSLNPRLMLCLLATPVYYWCFDNKLKT